MKKIQILLVTLFLFISMIYMPTTLATGGGGDDVPWGGPDVPPDGTCINDTGYLTNATPYNSEEDIVITEKGVQTCINVTVPQGCEVDITFQWLNWSQYFDIWLLWAYEQDWWWDNIDWASEPTWDNDSLWTNYSNWTISSTQQLCSWHENASCYTEGDWTTEWNDWRVIADFTCANNVTYNTTCYYYFVAEECSVSYIYPPSPNGTACPCCDCICITVDNSLGHNMNVTVYGREDDYPHYDIFSHYENISNGTYCFCLDTIQPTITPHAVAHSHTAQNVTVIDTWYNVTFDHGDGYHIHADPLTGIVTILSYGHYSATFWVAVQDSSANPTGQKMAVRVLQNGTMEVDGSYRELEFTKQAKEQHLSSFIHEALWPGTTMQFQYIGDSINQAITTTGTWSTDNVSFYAYIQDVTIEEHHPLRYNETYYWYVNITDTVTGEQTDSTIYQFRTAESPELCPCGLDALKSATGRGEIIRFGSLNDLASIAFILAIVALLLIIILYHKRNNKEEEMEEEVINDGP